MTKRTPRQQTKHNKTVANSAAYYKSRGYKVQADINGFQQPGTIRGRRPDIVARKGKDVVIVEVETKDTVQKDKKQQEVFRQHSKVNKNVRFRRKLAK